MGMAGQVVVIGLDGATFTLLQPWMEQGYLPFLQSLVEQGVSGPLLSSIPPATVPAWQCFMTGKNPGKHGVPWFLKRQPDSYDEIPIGPGHCEARTLWDLLSEGGKRLAVFNVPYSSAGNSFNGVLIGGFDTSPARMAAVTYPPGLLQEIEARFGVYQVQLKTPGLLLAHRSATIIESFLRDCQTLTDYQFRVAHAIVEREPFDLVMFYQLVPDRIQHWLWHLLDATHPWHDHALARQFYEQIVVYYRRLDEHLAKLVGQVGADPTVLVMSDHGFGPVHKGIDLSTWLLQEGYLRIKQRPLSQLKLRLWKLGWGPLALSHSYATHLLRWGPVQRWFARTFAAQGEVGARAKLGRIFHRLFLQRGDIDWRRSKAYCLSGFGMLRLNVQGREPEGAVPPEQYQAVRDEIAAKLRDLRDPTTDLPVNGQVIVREEAYHGRFADEMPDLVYLTLEQGYIIEQPMALPFVSKRVVIEDPKISGTHRMHGLLIAKGPMFKNGARIDNACLMDLAPTILYLLGSPVPDDMDGRVLTEAFKEDFLKEHPIAYREAELDTSRQETTLTVDEQAVILERLEGLGYID
jgi:predicted AlkP superfamily phosphohydrolase/phosphomutase